MVQFWVGMRRLTAHWKPLILFEILWKLVTLLVIAPACAGLIQLAIHLAKLKYLTTSNLLQFLRSPWTILLLAVLLLLAALYTLFEIAAVCTCFRQSRFQKVRTTLGRMVRSGLQSVLHFFRGGGPFLVLHLLVLIPLMQFSATSGIFTAMGIPDFLAYYMTKKEFLLPIYVAAIILCCLLSVRWVFSSVLFTQNQCSYRSARATSVQLVRGRFWQTFFSVLVWNCCYFAALLVFLCLITVVVLMVIRATGSNDLIMSQAMRILKLLIQIVLWSFSFFATPICMAHLTALLEKRCVQMPEVVLPEPVPLSRSAKPFRRSTAVLTACCFTVAALGLNLSYVYSVFTGKANFRLALFQNPTVMAHRGLSADAPENTLYAFSDAISVGADFIELDVQQTRDGVLVVMHDSNLKRTTGVNKDIWDVDYADIQNLDAGSWFDPAYANARIPTLEETLQFVDKRAKLNIEIKPTKHGSDTLEQDVAELITRYQYTDACYVTSFSYGSLKKVKEANPEIRTGYLMSVAYGQFYSLKYADAFSLNKVFVTSQVVNAAHQQGKQIFAWTVNSMSEVRSLCNLHVDSIITDDPVMVQNVISRDSTGETLRSVLDYFIN
ncbi:MAG: glycerophosphodiester phosphodiesterase family protein [Ruminococcus callidus]|uniref:glycerophosphodiester phosphodiesterase n=1 Tax=Ruminococcus callidus TaxID=40519 RepID=UPI0023EF62A4|nr:glycerophosphodiester phosphodiesterase [Ruminococcus callidus]MBS6597346.1 glycerophosphodiester phosphodiesterase [Ruminococcus callidus]